MIKFNSKEYDKFISEVTTHQDRFCNSVDKFPISSTSFDIAYLKPSDMPKGTRPIERFLTCNRDNFTYVASDEDAVYKRNYKGHKKGDKRLIYKRQCNYNFFYSNIIKAWKDVPTMAIQVSTGLTHFQREVIVLDIDESDVPLRMISYIRDEWRPNFIIRNPNTNHYQIQWVLKEAIYTSSKFMMSNFLSVTRQINMACREIAGLFGLDRNKKYGDLRYTGWQCKNPFSSHLELVYSNINRRVCLEEIADIASEAYSDETASIIKSFACCQLSALQPAEARCLTADKDEDRNREDMITGYIYPPLSSSSLCKEKDQPTHYTSKPFSNKDYFNVNYTLYDERLQALADSKIDVSRNDIMKSIMRTWNKQQRDNGYEPTWKDWQKQKEVVYRVISKQFDYLNPIKGKCDDFFKRCNTKHFNYCNNSYREDMRVVNGTFNKNKSKFGLNVRRANMWKDWAEAKELNLSSRKLSELKGWSVYKCVELNRKEFSLNELNDLIIDLNKSNFQKHQDLVDELVEIRCKYEEVGSACCQLSALQPAEARCLTADKDEDRNREDREDMITGYIYPPLSSSSLCKEKDQPTYIIQSDDDEDRNREDRNREDKEDKEDREDREDMITGYIYPPLSSSSLCKEKDQPTTSTESDDTPYSTAGSLTATSSERVAVDKPSQLTIDYNKWLSEQPEYIQMQTKRLKMTAEDAYKLQHPFIFTGKFKTN